MDKEPKKRPLIVRTSPTDYDFAYYHTNDGFEDVKKIIRERKYTVGETDVAYRVMSHWDAMGILPDGVKGGKDIWRKFTLVERVWLEAVKRMRVFGLSLDKIASVKKAVMTWNEKFQSYMDFEYFVIKAWVSEVDPYILVLANGEADVGSMAEIELAKMFYGNKDKLLISIKSILQEMGLTVKTAKSLLDISDDEIELLSEIRVKGGDEIKAKTDEAGRITHLETTFIKKHTKENPLSFQVLRDDFKKDSGFGKTELQWENGMPQTTKITRKRKLKK